MLPPMGNGPERYQTLRDLRAGKTLTFMGVPLRASEDQALLPGRTYVAERNTGPYLLTVKTHVVENSVVGGYVVSAEGSYPFDASECVVVDLLLDRSTTRVKSGA